MGFWRDFFSLKDRPESFGADEPRRQDHDLSVLKMTPTSGAWEKVEVCPLCTAPTGYQEYMTKICLSCGQQMPVFPYRAAKRDVVLGGVWREEIFLHGRHYVRHDGEWITVEKWREKTRI